MADKALITSLATPIAIVIAGVIVAGAVFYTNSNSSSTEKVTGTSTTSTLGSKYQKFVDLAGEVGLNTGDFGACMEEFDTAEIKKDLSDAASYGANGTPAFFVGKSGNGTVNGVKISGAYPIETFKGVIEGLTEGNDQKILDALGPIDEAGTLPASVAEVSKEVAYDDDPVKGDPNAPITIVEFSDYECPFCQRHFNTTHGQLVSEFIDTGKVKLIFRDLPLSFHDPVATQAAVAANCAREQGGDEAYFKYHDEYFTRTNSNGQGL